MCTWFLLVRRTSKILISYSFSPSGLRVYVSPESGGLYCRICIRVPCIHVLVREAIRMGPRWSGWCDNSAIQGAHLLDFPLSLDLWAMHTGGS
jgi:hypothetical protein